MLVRKLLILLVALTPVVAAAAPDDKADKPKSPNAGKKIIFERVVAVINDSIILRSELEARMVPVIGEAQQIADPKERERRIDKLRGQILDEMVNEELIVQAAEGAKIEVEASEVQAALDEIKSTNNLDDAALAQVLAAQGYTLGNYKTDLRRQLLRLRAVNQLVAPKVTVTDEDIKARYDEMQRRSASVSAVKLSHACSSCPSIPPSSRSPRPGQGGQGDRPREGQRGLREGRKRYPTTPARRPPAASWAGSSATPSPTPSGSRSCSRWRRAMRGPVMGPQGMHVFYVSEVKKSDLKQFSEMKEQLARIPPPARDGQADADLDRRAAQKAYIDIKLQ